MDHKVQKLNLQPNYKKLYYDLISAKHPDKLEKCRKFFDKDGLLTYDVISLNNLIADRNKRLTNKYRSYDKATIDKILNYQKEKELNNKQTADHFGVSRNSVIKWKKLFA